MNQKLLLVKQEDNRLLATSNSGLYTLTFISGAYGPYENNKGAIPFTHRSLNIFSSCNCVINRKQQKHPSSSSAQMRKKSQREVQNNAYIETMVDVDSTRYMAVILRVSQ